MYDLPSGEADASGTLVDLIDDEDLEMMWEELDVMHVSETGAPGRLTIHRVAERSMSYHQVEATLWLGVEGDHSG